jgi:hypothetical protein
MQGTSMSTNRMSPVARPFKESIRGIVAARSEILGNDGTPPNRGLQAEIDPRRRKQKMKVSGFWRDFYKQATPLGFT